MKDLKMKLMVLGPSDIIWIYFMLASIIAITATIPILAFQIWLCVKPALKPNEISQFWHIYQRSSYLLLDLSLVILLFSQ